MRAHFLAAVVLSAAMVAAAEPLPNPFRDIPAERNGWALLVEATELVTGEDANRSDLAWAYPGPWQPTPPGITRHMAINEPALARFEQAIALPEIVPPLSEATWRAGMPLGGRPSELARLKVQRAYLRQAQGDLLAALRDLDDLLTYTDRRDDSACSMVDYMTTHGIRRIALSGVRQVLGPPPAYLDPATIDPTDLWQMLPYAPAERAALESLARHIGDESRCMSALRWGFGGELVRDGRELVKPEYHEGPVPSEADIAQTLAYGNELLRTHLAITALPPWQRDWRRLRAVRRPACMETEGTLGQLYTYSEGFWRGMADQVDRDRGLRRMTALAIALRLYAADHGRLPSRLDQLVTERYLAALPLDPYDGRPIRYLPREGLLYCLGSDRRDQLGTRKDDLVARLDFVRTPPMPPRPNSTPPPPEDDRPRRPVPRGAASLR